MKRKATPETDLIRAALKWCSVNGIIAHRMNSGRTVIRDPKYGVRVLRSAAKGTADIIGCLRYGKFFAAEAKVGRNMPTQEQRLYLEAVRENGGESFVFRTLGEFMEIVR